MAPHEIKRYQFLWAGAVTVVLGGMSLYRTLNPSPDNLQAWADLAIHPVASIAGGLIPALAGAPIAYWLAGKRLRRATAGKADIGLATQPTVTTPPAAKVESLTVVPGIVDVVNVELAATAVDPAGVETTGSWGFEVTPATEAHALEAARGVDQTRLALAAIVIILVTLCVIIVYVSPSTSSSPTALAAASSPVPAGSADVLPSGTPVTTAASAPAESARPALSANPSAPQPRAAGWLNQAKLQSISLGMSIAQVQERFGGPGKLDSAYHDNLGNHQNMTWWDGSSFVILTFDNGKVVDINGLAVPAD